MRIANDAVPLQPRPYCYDDDCKACTLAKRSQVLSTSSSFLPGFTFKVHFNKGGIAVWGETYAKIYSIESNEVVPGIAGYDGRAGSRSVRYFDGLACQTVGRTKQRPQSLCTDARSIRFIGEGIGVPSLCSILITDTSLEHLPRLAMSYRI